MFIYCFDENYKNELIKKGLSFIKQETVDNKTAYLFALTDKINFDELDKTKVFISNLMKFNM